MIKQEIKKVVQVFKSYSSFFITGLLFAVIIYYLLISNQLVNSNDGLWEYNYYKSGSWSLSLGRWFLLYLDRLRFGISTEPITSLMALTFFSAGIVFILDLFELEKNKIGYIISMLFISSTAVCVTLSYRFTSPSYGLAFLLNTMAAWTIIKIRHNLLSILASGGLIALAMGTYQSFIGCTCIVLVGYFIYTLQKKEIRTKEIITDAIKSLLSAALGAVLYICILNIHLKVFHVAMADYSGADTYSIGNTIKSLYFSIPNTYRVFTRYFIEGYFKTNILQDMKIYIIIFTFMAILLVIGFINVIKISKIRAFLFILLIAAIPIATNAVLLIATSAWTSLLMTAPMALCIPVMACVGTKLVPESKKWIAQITTILLTLLLYGNIYQVQIDQEAMLEGKIATTTMANDIIHDLNETGYLNADLKYCILGTPAGNKMFKTSRLYPKANQDALFGTWINEVGCSRRSWQGVFTYLCGANLEICTLPEYGMILESEIAQTMNTYPTEGYITKLNDIVVIKISE